MRTKLKKNQIKLKQYLNITKILRPDLAICFIALQASFNFASVFWRSIMLTPFLAPWRYLDILVFLRIVLWPKWVNLPPMFFVAIYGGISSSFLFCLGKRLSIPPKWGNQSWKWRNYWTTNTNNDTNFALKGDCYLGLISPVKNNGQYNFKHKW